MQEDKSTAAGRFIKAKPNSLKALQDFGLKEADRIKKKKKGEINTAPSKSVLDKFYDYDAAKKAGAKPDASGHWPSEFKKPGHPNEVVGGFNTRTGERVMGTKRGTEKELRASGWDAASAKKMGATGDVNLPIKTASKEVHARMVEEAKKKKK